MGREKVEIVENNGKKYIDGEEILYEYDCWTNWILIRFFLLLILLIGLSNHYFLRLHQYNFESFFVVGFLLVIFIGWTTIDFKTIVNKGFYITNNNLITFSGKKVALEDIYYRYSGGGVEWGSVSLRLYRKSKLLISCLDTNTKYYQNMIDFLERFSNNHHLKIQNIRDAKRKLIQLKGENDGK